MVKGQQKESSNRLKLLLKKNYFLQLGEKVKIRKLYRNVSEA